MSYANYGPTYRDQLIANDVGNVAVPAVANGAALVEVEIVQTAGAAAKRLVLGEGVWVLNARAFFNPADAGGVILFAQASIVNFTTGNTLASSASIYGSNSADSTHIAVGMTASTIVVVAAGATLNLAWLLRVTGNPAGSVLIGGQSFMSATKLD